MKKLLLISAISFASTLAMSQNIGENYEAGSYSISGYGEIDLDESKEIDINPQVDFYVADGVSVGVGTGLSLWDNGDGFNKGSYFYLGSSMSYTFGYDPQAQKGLAYTVGGGAWLGSGTYRGERGDASIQAYSVFQADYFLAPRISFFGRVNPISLNLTADENEDVVNTNFLQFQFGINFHIANKDVQWSNVSNK